MDGGEVCSGGKLEALSIYYFGAGLLAARWRGHSLLLPVEEAEPEPRNGQMSVLTPGPGAIWTHGSPKNSPDIPPEALR